MTPFSSGEASTDAVTQPDVLPEPPVALPRPTHQTMVWRLRLLAGLVLLLCLSIFLGARWMSSQRQVALPIHATPSGQLQVTTSDTPAWSPYAGWEVHSLEVPGQAPMRLDATVLEHSLRWIVQTQDRHRHAQQRQYLSGITVAADSDTLTQVQVHLISPEGKSATALAPVVNRTWHGVGLTYWALSLLALAVASVGFMVALISPQWRNLAFMWLTLGQGIHLYLMAMDLTMGIWAPWPFVQLEAWIRLAVDISTGAALIQVAAQHPKTLPQAHWISMSGWLAAMLMGLLCWLLPSPWDWWLTQGSCLLTVGGAIWLMSLRQRRQPHPLVVVLRRLTAITLLTWTALSLAVGLAETRIDMRLGVTHYGILVWHIFFASQLILTPFLSRARPILQEFSLLAASSTVAAALDLFFVAVFALGPFASMALSLFLALGVYVLIRRWVVSHVLSRDPLTTERLFERLYRMARELERRPDRLEEVMRGLLNEMFEPIEAQWLLQDVRHSVIREHGGVLLVPLPRLTTNHDKKAFLLRHADKGRRLFTEEDARLADRIVDQIDQALRYDRAVERGRSEERMRLAQDLHDDIGARLLTLMYQAPNPSIEEYIRHTLQDLKTLTRGLAVQSHTLTEAASEWKRDVSHRLQVAQCELDWHFACDQDPELSVVQWSALTRILRELVNNTISHARATKVRVSLTLGNDEVRLVVSDNGVGRDPANWSHGLGLGGVRKRVKQLGGQVSWLNAEPGITCEVVVPQFSVTPTN